MTCFLLSDKKIIIIILLLSIEKGQDTSDNRPSALYLMTGFDKPRTSFKSDVLSSFFDISFNVAKFGESLIYERRELNIRIHSLPFLMEGHV